MKEIIKDIYQVNYKELLDDKFRETFREAFSDNFSKSELDERIKRSQAKKQLEKEF